MRYNKSKIVVITVCSLLLHYSVLFAVEGDTASGAGAAAEVADVPMGQSGSGDVSLLPEDVGEVEGEGDLFGLEGGYIHPYIMLNLEYTDNLYNVEDGTENSDVESLITTISPGIWFALPRKKVIPIDINPHNSSPGGLQLQFEDYGGTDRWQAYALGGLDFKFYSEDDSLDATDGILEGLLRYNMSSGLSLQLVDRFTHSEDKLERGSSTRDQIRRYDSNFFMATADWDITEKLRLQLDYFNFYLGYEDEINQFLDRVDNGLDLYGYFNYSLNTSFFLEWKYVDIAYDIATELDSYTQFIYAGVKWDTTEKLSTLFKLGYQERVFDELDEGQEDYDGWAFDLQLTYRFSEKTVFELAGYRANEETDNYLAYDKIAWGVDFSWFQRFSERWTGTLNVDYVFLEYSNYDQLTDEDREDTEWHFRPAIQYLFRDWLQFELAYRYDYRDSTDDFFDYDTNTFIFNAKLAL